MREHPEQSSLRNQTAFGLVLPTIVSTLDGGLNSFPPRARSHECLITGVVNLITCSRVSRRVMPIRQHPVFEQRLPLLRGSRSLEETTHRPTSLYLSHDVSVLWNIACLGAPSIKRGLQHSSIITDRLALAYALIGIVNPAPKKQIRQDQ